MNPFVTEGSKEAPVELTVPQLLTLFTPNPQVDGYTVTARVAADGYLVAIAHGGDGLRPVVTAWAGQGQGKTHGRPERWRQNYHHAYAEQDTAERRFQTVLAQHGGLASGGDQ